MLTLSAKIRKIIGKKTKSLRQGETLPAVLYGPKIENKVLEVELKSFEKIHKEAGENTLISLEIEGEKEKYLVLIHNLTKDPLTDKLIHVDFYQPSLEKEIEGRIPVILEGEAPAVKDLEGTLIKNISEIFVKALPQNLPKEIKVRINDLKTFQDRVLIKDLDINQTVKILNSPEDIVVSVAPPEKVKEELEKPIEEKVEEVEKIEKKPATAETGSIEEKENE